MLSRFCVSNGTRSLSKNITLPSVQVGNVMSEKVAAPLSSSSASFNVSSVSVFIFKLPYLIPWWLSGGWGVGAPYNNLYGKALPKRVPLSIQDKLLHVIFNFWHGQAKATNGKNAFKLERYSSSMSPNFTDVCMVGAGHKLNFYMYSKQYYFQGFR